MRIARLTFAGLGAGALLAIAAPLAAQAHVSVTPDEAAAGSYTVLTFAVGHGCDGSPTTSIAVDIPEGILSVTPTVKSGYTVEKVMEALPEATEGAHGETLTERVGQVVYTAATPLADGYRDTFDIQVLLPEDAAGETLLFPVLQTCAEGETDWNEETPADGTEPEHPAPAVVVAEATGDAHGHGGDATAEPVSDAHDDAHAEAAASTDATTDTLARVLGVGGLVVGVIGLVLAITARTARKQS
ncbi:YcnI family protein [Agromyces sp. MMS24-K17]|uniref:YcnI family copper-binding membrane protein n=1 Tax=Agromyces sp. MMS24-K17 TaxID=3372850 RepID=UPI003754A0FA